MGNPYDQRINNTGRIKQIEPQYATNKIIGKDIKNDSKDVSSVHVLGNRFNSLRTEDDVDVNNPYESFDGVKGKIVELLSTQGGNRFLQKVIEELRVQALGNQEQNGMNINNFQQDPASRSDQLHGGNIITNSAESAPLLARVIDDILDELGITWQVDEMYFSHLLPLCCDQFANYTCQKIILMATRQQRIKIAQILQRNILTISQNSFGTRVIQRLIETANTSDQRQAVSRGLQNHVAELSRDPYGVHTVLRTIAVWSGDWVSRDRNGNVYGKHQQYQDEDR
ncbi:MAG: hypothetical protein EZS28_030045, partial [Streblomastix strix]